MASSVDLVFNLIGKDKTSAAFKSAGDSMGRLGKSADDAGRKVSRSGDDADRAGSRMRGAFKGVDGALGSVATAAARAGAALGAIAIGGVAVGLVKSAKAASDLGESINAVNVTFGEAADGIQQLGKESAKSLGLSRAEFNGLAVQFSNFAQTVAGPGGDVAKTMDELTTRASDFASVMNLDVAEAATLFQSGLAGETEPLRKYGIDLSAAAVEAYALANGIGDGTGELTEQEKVLARYGILMESTAKTAGDFTNTQGSMANQLKLLKANATDFAATVGTAFTPLAEAVMPQLNQALVDMSGKLQANMPAISEAMRDFGTKAGEAVAQVVEKWPQIQTAIGDVAAKVRENWPDIKEAAENLGAVLERVGQVAQAAWDAWKGLPPEAQQTIATLAILDKTGVVDVKMVVTPMISGAAGAIGGVLGGLFTGAAAAVVLPVAVTIAAVVEWTNEALLPLWNGEKTWWELVKERFQIGLPPQIQLFTIVWDEEGEGSLRQRLEDLKASIGENMSVASGTVKQSWSQIVADTQQGMISFGMSVGLGMANAGSAIMQWKAQAEQNVQQAVDNITRTVGAAWAMVQVATSQAWAGVTGAISQAWASITATVAVAVGIVRGAVSQAWTAIQGATSQAWGAITGATSSAWSGIVSTIGGAMNAARGVVAGALGAIQGMFASAVGAIGATWSRITGVVQAPIVSMFGAINRGMIGPINNVLGVFSDTLRIDPLVPVFHSGGSTEAVGGPGAREGLALLRNDEFVMSPQATAKHRTLLEALNAGRQGFGIGGPFDAIGDLAAQVKEWAMAGAGNAMGRVVDPAVSWLRDTYGGKWPPNVIIAGMDKAGEAAKAWASGEDSRRAAASSMATVGGAYIGPNTGILGRPLASYVVTSEYGPRWGTFHAGIDLGAPGGTPIYAAAAGLVQQAGWNDGYGNYLRMDHGAGLGTSYGHMSAIIARAGQTLAAGQLLGLVGTTGDSTGNHLHFETYQNGAAVNPRAFVGFDSGGWLQPGITATANNTGKPEAVLTAEQWRTLAAAASGRTVVEVYLDGRLLNESLVRYRREAGVV